MCESQACIKHRELYIRHHTRRHVKHTRVDGRLVDWDSRVIRLARCTRGGVLDLLLKLIDQDLFVLALRFRLALLLLQEHGLVASRDNPYLASPATYLDRCCQPIRIVMAHRHEPPGMQPARTSSGCAENRRRGCAA